MGQDDFGIKFGLRLRWLRQQHHLTLKELEERSGISRSSLSVYERGKGNPTLQTLERLACVFSIPVSQLLGETSEQAPQATPGQQNGDFEAEPVHFGLSPSRRRLLGHAVSYCLDSILQIIYLMSQERPGDDGLPPHG